jgi:hypothetical protein
MLVIISKYVPTDQFGVQNTTGYNVLGTFSMHSGVATAIETPRGEDIFSVMWKLFRVGDINVVTNELYFRPDRTTMNQKEFEYFKSLGY